MDHAAGEVIASWIVRCAPGHESAAAERLRALEGARLRPCGEAHVVTTACPPGDLRRIHGMISDVPGVVSVSLVAAFHDVEEDRA
jgi:nitrate reductase NapAB chaperone NapD